MTRVGSQRHRKKRKTMAEKNNFSSAIMVKCKGTIHPGTGHKGPEGE